MMNAKQASKQPKPWKAEPYGPGHERIVDANGEWVAQMFAPHGTAYAEWANANAASSEMGESVVKESLTTQEAALRDARKFGYLAASSDLEQRGPEFVWNEAERMRADGSGR